MKAIIRKYTGSTPMAKELGKAFDAALHGSFTGRVSVPLQEILGGAVSLLNMKGLVTNNVLESFDMDALAAENKQNDVLSEVLGALSTYAAGYGRVETYKANKRGNWITHWRLKLDAKAFRMLEVEEKLPPMPTLKRLRKAQAQKRLCDKLGINTEVSGLDALYLSLLGKQYVDFRVNKKEVESGIENVYSESKKMATGKIKYKRTKRTAKLVERHMKTLSALDDKMFPISEKLEPRGRTAKHMNSIYGCNFYGKTWETQSFHLGEETVAWDARQSVYQIIGGLLGAKGLNIITGTYGKYEAGDIYVDVFMKVLQRVFPYADISKITRDIAKKPSQMLAYMAGMASILLEDDDGNGSIWSHLSAEGDDLDEYCDLLELEFWNEPLIIPIMELREAVRAGHQENKAVPYWSFPSPDTDGTSTYFFSRNDTSFIKHDGGVKREAVIFFITDDAGVQHQMSIHIRMIRDLAKSSAILAAIIHSIDGFIKKQVSIDVWAVGGKILVKHDEFICGKEHESVMIASYHKWLAYVAANRHLFLEVPLETCGYVIDLNALVKNNAERFGKFETKYVKQSRNGLKYEWTIRLDEES